jgi:hypothetical protein
MNYPVKEQRETAERALEDLIDSHQLDAVLDMIATICIEKADHLTSNWQDSGAAKCWTKAANSISRLSVSERINAVS